MPTKRALREPLVQFLLAGALLFGGYRLLNPQAGRGDPSHRIELTQDDLRQLTVTWLAQGRPPPTSAQMSALIDSRVQEEILYREALELGLDRGDTIVKRRLAQKMEFLTDDLSDLVQPSPAELEAWYPANADRFAQPPRVTFRHLYFSPDRHGAATREAAEGALASLSGKPAEAPEAAELGDPFMFQASYGDRSPEQVAKELGVGFARAVFELPPGSWQGPIESGFGWHAVFVDSVTPQRVPPFDEVEAEIAKAFVETQREAYRRAAFERMKARYVVVLPE